MYFIGVDLGTSAVKLVLADDKGVIQNIVSREYPIAFPHPGWSEQNPSDWLEQSVLGIRELTAGIPADEVAGISFGGQMHGLVVLDKNDQVLRPAILWNDGRTVRETQALNTESPGAQKLAEYTGNIAFAGFTAPKILWMREHEPELFAKIDKVMLPKDYLLYCFTGRHCTDYSDASGMLLVDVEHKCWSEPMLELCGLKKDQMPQLCESSDVVGNLLPGIAERCGLTEYVKVIAGAGDNAAAAIGTGTVGDGKCNISLGTSGTLFISSDRYYALKNHALHFFAHADGKYHFMGCMLSAASCNKWWMDDIIGTDDYASEQKQIEKLGENQVFYLPYLMGERSPHNDPALRAAFLGMSMDTTRADMTQAVLEGVAFGMRDSLEIARNMGISVTAATICGGGAKSPLWRKIVANVMNLEVSTLACEEGPGYGAAILAMVGCGVYKSVDEAVGNLVKKKDTIQPDPVLVEKYETKYQKFRRLLECAQIAEEC